MSSDGEPATADPSGQVGPEGGRGASDDVSAGPGKPWLLVLVAGGVLVLDQATKWWVVQNLTLHEIVPVWGDFFRLTYTHNFGAAFGIDVGQYSRVFFLALAIIALAVLMYLYVHTPRRRRLRLWALALVSGGAVGNVVDRIRYRAGVVDFLDVGVGSLRWPVFNVADMAVSIGAVLLMVTFYREETGQEPRVGSERRASRSGRAGGRTEESTDERVPAGED